MTEEYIYPISGKCSPSTAPENIRNSEENKLKRTRKPSFHRCFLMAICLVWTNYHSLQNLICLVRCLHEKNCGPYKTSRYVPYHPDKNVNYPFLLLPSTKVHHLTNFIDILLFRKYQKMFVRKSFWTAPNHDWEGTRKICNSSYSRIINLAFSSAVSTLQATIYIKFNKFKLCIWMFFNNTYMTTSKPNFF